VCRCVFIVPLAACPRAAAGLHRIAEPYSGSPTTSRSRHALCNPIRDAGKRSGTPERAGDAGASVAIDRHLETKGDADGAAPVGADGVASAPRRPVVLLMHGLMQDSESFMVDSRERGLAFVLYDAGYVCASVRASWPGVSCDVVPCPSLRSPFPLPPPSSSLLLSSPDGYCGRTVSRAGHHDGECELLAGSMCGVATIAATSTATSICD
jgi:hypothetical protein